MRYDVGNMYAELTHKIKEMEGAAVDPAIIPADASKNNKLVDTAAMNTAIGTATTGMITTSDLAFTALEVNGSDFTAEYATLGDLVIVHANGTNSTSYATLPTDLKPLGNCYTPCYVYQNALAAWLTVYSSNGRVKFDYSTSTIAGNAMDATIVFKKKPATKEETRDGEK